MEQEAFVQELTRALQAGETVATSLGTFFVKVAPAYMGVNPRTGEDVPVRARRVPCFVPADGLLEQLEGRFLAESFYRDYFAQDYIGQVDPAYVESVYCDRGDAGHDAAVPDATRSIELEELFARILASLQTKKRFKASGLGAFRVTTIRKGRAKGKQLLVFAPSQVLKNALDELAS